jgi:hypothetical protein
MIFINIGNERVVEQAIRCLVKLHQSIAFSGTEEHNIAIIIGDANVYTADSTALKGMPSLYYHKLAYLERDIAGLPWLSEICAGFTVSTAGKPIH